MGLPAEYKHVMMLNPFLQLEVMAGFGWISFLGYVRPSMQGLGGVLVVNVHMQETPSSGWLLLFEAEEGNLVWMCQHLWTSQLPTRVKHLRKLLPCSATHLCFCVDVAENNHLFIALFFLLKKPLPTTGRHLSGKAGVTISGFQELVWEMKLKSYWFSL